jgi:hypothetical protein
MRDIQDSHSGTNSVGKLNVSGQSVKHKNSKGAAIKGNYEIWFLIFIHSIILLSNSGNWDCPGADKQGLLHITSNSTQT